MKTGISIYLSSPLQDIERTIERGAAAGARYAFTSLHIPEDGGAAYADKVRHVLSLLSARGIALIADVGPRTCDLLGLERIEDLRDLGLEYLRFDYGFSAQRVAELSGVFRIVVNASTVSSDEIASWREAGADVTRFAACHNFYPKPYTGLALEDIARVNLRLAALGFEIMAFVPGDANVRGPVFEGLPTVEAQRGRASKVALNMLELAHGADCDIVLVGDPDLSDAGSAQFAQVSAGYVDLQCELEPGYAYVRGQIHHDRPDSSVLIFRSQESRTTLKPDSVSTDAGAGLPRKAGSIAVSNSGYGRYEGELEIARVDLPKSAFDERQQLHCLGRDMARNVHALVTGKIDPWATIGPSYEGASCGVCLRWPIYIRRIPMTVLFVEYPKCSTCKKAKAWLDEHGVEYIDRDIVLDNPTADELATWIAHSGLPVRRFFNSSGMKYRELGLKARLDAGMTDRECYELLATDGMLVKRPLLVGDDFAIPGFRESAWAEALL